MLRTATWHCVLRDISCHFWRLRECCTVSVEETGCLWISMYCSPTSDLCYAQMEGINGKLHSPLLPFSECQVGRDTQTLCTLLCMGLPRAAEPGPGPVLYSAVTTYSGVNNLKSRVLLPKVPGEQMLCLEDSPQHHFSVVPLGRRATPPRLRDTAFLSQVPPASKTDVRKLSIHRCCFTSTCLCCSLCRVQSSLVLQPGYHPSQVEEIINLFLICFRSGCSWSKNKKHSLTAKSNWPWVTDYFKLS